MVKCKASGEDSDEGVHHYRNVFVTEGELTAPGNADNFHA
jgi:hypothetical protein